MALQNSDLLYVQRGTDSYKMEASQIAAFIEASPAVVYRGTVDCTAAVGAQLNPNPPVAGDLYVNTGDGTVDGTGADATDSWVGIGGEAIEDGRTILFNGTNWTLGGTLGDAGVNAVSGTAPITATGTDSVTIGINAATNAAPGSAQLAKETYDGDGKLTTDNASDVLIQAHFDELAGRITTAAGGGIQTVVGTSPIESSINGGGDTATISIVDATTAQKGAAQLTGTVAANDTTATTGNAVIGYAVPLDLSGLTELPA